MSLHGEIAQPIQVLDRTTSECLLSASRARATLSKAASTYKAAIRASAEDGASSNKKYEREGGILDRPSSRAFSSDLIVSCRCTVTPLAQ